MAELGAKFLGQEFRREVAGHGLEFGQSGGLHDEPMDVGLADPDVRFRIPDRLDVEWLGHGAIMRPYFFLAKG